MMDNFWIVNKNCNSDSGDTGNKGCNNDFIFEEGHCFLVLPAKTMRRIAFGHWTWQSDTLAIVNFPHARDDRRQSGG
jgi:hypothetical protein